MEVIETVDPLDKTETITQRELGIILDIRYALSALVDALHNQHAPDTIGADEA